MYIVMWIIITCLNWHSLLTYCICLLVKLACNAVMSDWKGYNSSLWPLPWQPWRLSGRPFLARCGSTLGVGGGYVLGNCRRIFPSLYWTVLGLLNINSESYDALSFLSLSTMKKVALCLTDPSPTKTQMRVERGTPTVTPLFPLNVSKIPKIALHTHTYILSPPLFDSQPF